MVLKAPDWHKLLVKHNVLEFLAGGIMILGPVVMIIRFLVGAVDVYGMIAGAFTFFMFGLTIAFMGWIFIK